MIGEVFAKKSGKTPHQVIDICRRTITVAASAQAPVGLVQNIIITGSFRAGKETITRAAPAIPIKVVAAPEEAAGESQGLSCHGERGASRNGRPARYSSSRARISVANDAWPVDSANRAALSAVLTASSKRPAAA